MSIDIGQAFSDGVDEFLSRKGAALAGVFFVVTLVSSLASGSLILAIAETIEGEPEVTATQLEQLRSQAQFGLDIGIGPSIVLLIAFGLVAELARIVAISALADGSSNRLRPRHYSNGILKLFVYRVLVTIVVFVLYGVLALVLFAPTTLFPPLILLTIPVFLYVAIALYFAPIAVVVDESSPLDAISNAWTYAKGNRLSLVAIAIGVFVVSFAITLPNLLFSGSMDAAQLGAEAITASPIAVVVSGVFGSLSTVFTLSVATCTYLQLAGDAADDSNMGRTADADQFGTETEF
jgi:hypothetical protein